MRILSWNCRRASSGHPLWSYFEELAPDVAILQEVTGLPAGIEANFDVRCATPPRARRLTVAHQAMTWTAFFAYALLVSGFWVRVLALVGA